MSTTILRTSLLLLSSTLLLSACGGGGGSGGSVALDADRYAASCAMPRSGNDPFNGNQPYPDRQGTLADERNWVRAYMDEIYLWSSEIPSVNASQYTVASFGSVPAALEAYFDDLLTPAVTPSGKYKDQFSFVADTAATRALSDQGIAVGYGIQFVLLAAQPPREALVAYVEPLAPTATKSSFARGHRILQIDGIDFVEAPSQNEVDVINAGLYPSEAGEQHVFTMQRPDLSTYTVTLTAQVIEQTPVQNVKLIDTDQGRVGYMLFNDHISTSESLLIAAMTQFRDADIDDLVIDLRYNGGGYLDIAAELAYMIGGAAKTNNKPFQQLQFNGHNPRAGDNDTAIPFHATAIGFDDAVTQGTTLPVLNLPRVFVLTTEDTCSASEALINGLRGVDIDVVQIGGTTCGKPYGFYSTDNCGLTYFAIEFAGVNAKNFGDYADGFTPDCAIGDDYTRAPGDPDEAMLSTALDLQAGGDCLAQPTLLMKSAGRAPQLVRNPLRENAYRRH